MKKIISILLAACLIFSLAAITASADDKVILKFASEGSETQQLNRGGHHWFIDLFNPKAENAEVQEFHNGQLGNVTQCLEQMAFGEPIILTTDASWLANLSEDIDIITGPYFCLNEEDYLKISETDWWKEQCDILYQNGYKVLNAKILYGTRQTIASKPLRTPDDYKGLKLRVPSNPMSVSIIEALGATATPLPYSEMYTSLQQGVVDGVENPLATLYDAKLFECAKYISMTAHQTTLTVTVMSAKAWEKLSPADQELLVETGNEAAEYYNAYIAKPADEEALKLMVDAGCEVIEDVDLEALKAATVSVYSERQELYDRVQSEIAAIA